MGTATNNRWHNKLDFGIFLRTVFACMVGVISLHAHALEPNKSLAQCRVDLWTQRDGLPARRIEALAQTRDGFLWMATRGGVVRFDGKTFRIFNYKNTANFFRDMAVSIAAGPHGQPWIGTDGGGCGPLTDSEFTPISTGSQEQLWSQQNVVYPARDGSVWLAGVGQFPLIHVRNSRVETFEENSVEGKAAAGCTGMAEDTAGRLWMVSWAGLQRRESDGKFHLVLPTPEATALIASPDGSLWIGTKHGLMQYKNGSTRQFTLRDGLPALDIRSLCLDHDGNLWIGTPEGLGRLYQGRFTRFDRNDGLVNNSIGPILEDREGSLWIGTDAGLNRIEDTKLTPVDFRVANGPAARVQGASAGADGRVWFGTSLGLFCVHGFLSEHVGTSNGASSQDIQSVVADGKGVYFADTAGDLYLYTSRRASVIARGSRIYHLARDAKGILAVSKDHVVFRLNGTKLSKIVKLPKMTWIFSACVDSHDCLWLATTIGAVQVRNGKAVVFDQGLPRDAHVLSVSEGSSGEMWMGTDKGLARLQNGRFRMYTGAQGLPDNNIYDAQEDGEGNIWVGGTRGLLKVRLADLDAADSGLSNHLDYTLYDDSDGIREFPVGGHQLRDRNGRLWFTGEKGATILDPRNMHTNLRIPCVLIEQSVADDKPIQAMHGKNLAPGTNKLEFRYVGLSLAAPERVMFRYRLIGYDKDWVDAGTRRAAYYTNLAPGAYRFEVTACNNEGVWNPVGASCSFTLAPHFYQTNWFYGVCFVALIGTVWGIGAIRSGALRARNRELERHVAARTSELHRSVKELHESTLMLERANVELQFSRHELVANNEELSAMNEELENANARLEALATTDGMTGIANHRAFQDQLRAVVSRAVRSVSCTTLLLCDVDRFKQFNDCYGHPAGDEVLRIVAGLLKDNIREGDFVARYGGEEFAVLLPHTDSAEAMEVAERLRSAIEQYAFPYREVTVSIGASAPMSGPVAPQLLVESADRALYSAKRSGRNRVVLADGGMPGIMDTEGTELTGTDRSESVLADIAIPTLPRAA